MTQPDNAFVDLNTREASQVAALDLGSNSFHLVVARIVAGSVQILHRVKQKVRLADGLDEADVLSPEAMQRGLNMLALVAQSLKGFEPDKVRIVATYTLRKAVNAHDFLVAAREVLPYPIEVIAGTEEARLIYMGVAHTNHAQGQSLVVDIGGGSTEFAIGEGFDPLLLRSLDMGCVSFTQRFFANGDISKKAFRRAVTAAEQELEHIEKRYRKLGWRQCFGTSGTIKAIAEACKALQLSPRAGVITAQALQQLAAMVLVWERVEHIQLEGISQDRREVLLAGLAILTAVFNRLDIDQMEYSSAALREGVLYEMEEELTQHTSVRARSAESLATRYDVDTEQARRVLATCRMLFDQVAANWQLSKGDLGDLLGWAALLHEVGLQINSRGVQRHSGYILQHVELPGFNQEQQHLLATLVSLHRNKIRQLETIEWDIYRWQDIRYLVALLRLGVLLNIKRQDDFVPHIEASASEQRINLSFPSGWLVDKPIINADLRREQHQIKALGLVLLINGEEDLTLAD